MTKLSAALDSLRRHTIIVDKTLILNISNK